MFILILFIFDETLVSAVSLSAEQEPGFMLPGKYSDFVLSVRYRVKYSNYWGQISSNSALDLWGLIITFLIIAINLHKLTL